MLLIYLGFSVYDAEDIEESKKPFIQQSKAVAIIANRYDGIDFPGDECRLLFIDGLPRATNAQERFLVSRMGANVLLNERIQTRVLQAIGRCTRSLQDYSAVVVSGDELPDYLNDRTRRSYLHPELQAELDFGIEQSKDANLSDLIENFDIFIKNGKEWEEANKQILSKRTIAMQKQFPAMVELQNVVVHEIEFQERLWQADYTAALGAAERVLAGLDAPELRGYRALWHYLAGSAAWLGRSLVPALEAKMRLQFENAKEAARGIPWLVELSRYKSMPATAPIDDQDLIYFQLERVEAIFSKLGLIHDRSFDRREKEILEGLASAKDFENAHRMLGEMLGFESGKRESDASPDPWWIAGKICFVFEDHADAKSSSSLDATKARQVASHPKWMKANIPLASDTDYLAVLVTPVSTATEGAMPHLGEVALWPLDEFRGWAKNALSTIRELRRTFSDSGDLAWRTQAAETFRQRGLDAKSLFDRLKQTRASKRLKVAP